MTHGQEGGYFRSALNLPLGETVAARIVAYWHHLQGFIDAVTPTGPEGADQPSGFKIEKAVNSGDRGGRLTLLIKPNDALSVTPRIVFQKLETNGFPRVDIYNILGSVGSVGSVGSPTSTASRAAVGKAGKGFHSTSSGRMTRNWSRPADGCGVGHSVGRWLTNVT